MPIKDCYFSSKFQVENCAKLYHTCHCKVYAQGAHRLRQNPSKRISPPSNIQFEAIPHDCTITILQISPKISKMSVTVWSFNCKWCRKYTKKNGPASPTPRKRVYDRCAADIDPLAHKKIIIIMSLPNYIIKYCLNFQLMIMRRSRASNVYPPHQHSNPFICLCVLIQYKGVLRWSVHTIRRRHNISSARQERKRERERMRRAWLRILRIEQV